MNLIVLLIIIKNMNSIKFFKCKPNASKCKNCTLEERVILNLIRENSTIKQEEIAQIIGMSLRTIKTRMIEMQEK